MAEHNILSAPVRDVSQPDNASWSDKYMGVCALSEYDLFSHYKVVDFLAIIDWMMSKSYGHSPQTYQELAGTFTSFKTTPISSLLSAATRGACMYI